MFRIVQARGRQIIDAIEDWPRKRAGIVVAGELRKADWRWGGQARMIEIHHIELELSAIQVVCGVLLVDVPLTTEQKPAVGNDLDPVSGLQLIAGARERSVIRIRCRTARSRIQRIAAQPLYVRIPLRRVIEIWVRAVEG